MTILGTAKPPHFSRALSTLPPNVLSLQVIQSSPKSTSPINIYQSALTTTFSNKRLKVASWKERYTAPRNPMISSGRPPAVLLFRTSTADAGLCLYRPLLKNGTLSTILYSVSVSLCTHTPSIKGLVYDQGYTFVE